MVEQMKPGSGGPEDKFRMVYIIFYWLGIGTLLPWNMFISVSSCLQLSRHLYFNINNKLAN